MSEINPHKNAYAIRITREMALDYGMVEPTPEERAKRDAEREEFARRKAALQARKGEILHALDRLADDPTLGHIVRHHMPDDDARRYCRGCDMGCSCEAAAWPCSTIALILDHHGGIDRLDTDDLWLIDWKGDL